MQTSSSSILVRCSDFVIPIVPETILLFYSALHDTSTSRSMRAIDSLNAVGTIIHHSSASLAVSALLANGELQRVSALLLLLTAAFPNIPRNYSHKSKSWCSSVHSTLGHAALVYPFAVQPQSSLYHHWDHAWNLVRVVFVFKSWDCWQRSLDMGRTSCLNGICSLVS